MYMDVVWLWLTPCLINEDNHSSSHQPRKHENSSLCWICLILFTILLNNLMIVIKQIKTFLRNCFRVSQQLNFSQHPLHASSYWGEQWDGETTWRLGGLLKMDPSYYWNGQAWFSCQHNLLLERSHGADLTCLAFLPQWGACALRGCFGCLPLQNLFAVFTASAVYVNTRLL